MQWLRYLANKHVRTQQLCLFSNVIISITTVIICLFHFLFNFLVPLLPLYCIIQFLVDIKLSCSCIVENYFKIGKAEKHEFQHRTVFLWTDAVCLWHPDSTVPCLSLSLSLSLYTQHLSHMAVGLCVFQGLFCKHKRAITKS